MQKCIGIIGVGNMGEALLAGLVNVNQDLNLIGSNLCFAEKRDERAAEIANKYGATRKEISEIASDCDLIFLVVKPQDLAATLDLLAPTLGEKTLLVSFVAGKTTAFIAGHVKPTSAVIRVMPNTPTLIGKGMAAISAGPNATQADLDLITTLLAASGEVVTVDESLQNAVTSLSGSGPAYFFAVVEAMVAAGIELGLSADVATTLANQTILGAAEMLVQTGTSPTTLRENVTSPHGTTAAALKVFSDAQLSDIIKRAMTAARDRSAELA
jgi:pyrroline-5-carboxylate reductase